MAATDGARKTLLALALPMVASFTLRFAFGMVDLVYARALGDPAAVAAIGLYFPFQQVFIATWVGLSAGLTAALGRAFGQRDAGRVRSLCATMRKALLGVVPAMMLLGVAVWFAAPSFGYEDDLTAAFRVYGTTMLVGMPLTGYWSILPDSIVKAHHDTRTTMLAGMFATAANLCLNSLFVFVFGWGLFGIAIATVLSRLVALAYASARAGALERAREAQPDWQAGGVRRATAAPVVSGGEWRLILALGLPATLSYVLTAGELGLVNVLLREAPDSTEAVAGFAVFQSLLQLALMPTVATSVAVLPYVARTAAEGDFGQIGRDLRQVALLAAGCGLIFTIPAGVLFPDSVGSFFVSDAESEALGSTAAQGLLRTLPLAALAMLPFLLLRPVFEAVHQPRRGVRITLLRFLVLSAPAILLGSWAAPRLGISTALGIVWGLVTAGVLTSVVTVWLVRDSLAKAQAGGSPSG